MKGFIPFSKGISPKVNAIMWLDFELQYYIAAAKHCHYTLGITLLDFFKTESSFIQFF